MIIAIDGPAAAGKGTVAEGLAKHFNFAFLDTGRIYRAVALAMLEKGLDPKNEDLAEEAAVSLSHINLYNILGNPKIRDEATGIAASIVAAQPRVRKALLDVQRNFAHNPYFPDNTKAKGAILDGRDICNTICPEAEVKLFVTASNEIRAKRRFKELQLKDKSVIYEHVLADLLVRDERDRTRGIAPLAPAKDAFILDTSDLDIDAAVAKAIEYASTFIS